MAEKSLFWNALPNTSYPTGYDRNYNADDISDWLASVLTTGVIKSNTALKVTPTSGMIVSVAAGRAVINGKPYTSDSAITFTVPTAPTGTTNRIDLIVIRFDRNVATRSTQLVYITGGAGGSIPAIKRNALYYDLVVCQITVQPNATAINAGDITDRRGDNDSTVTIEGGTSLGYCPWLVAAKGYDDYYDAIVLQYEDNITVASTSTVVHFNIPQYGWTGVDVLTVYTNGIRDDADTYTVTSNSTITFDSARTAGAKITVIVDKTIDGDGLGTALEQYIELQTIVLGLQSIDDYYYTCNGVDDNVKLSIIAQTWLNGGTDFGSKKINVIGTFGATAPNEGAGTSANRYKWFNLGQPTITNRRIIFDFSGCSQIILPITAGTYNDVFYGEEVNVIGVNLSANQTGVGTSICVFNTMQGVVNADNCRFWINSSLTSFISYTGTFTNCRGSISCTNGNAYCYFVSPFSQLRIINGEYYAYSGTAYTSAVVNGATTTGLCIMYAVNIPTVARAGYVQSYAVNITAAGKTSLTDTITLLPITAIGANIRGTLALSRAGRM